MKNQLSSRKFFSAMAFVALVISGIALLISKIFLGSNTTAATVLNSIAYVLAFIVTSFCAFLYVRTKRNLVWTIIYIVAVIIVVVPLVLTMFGK
ncbi:MAG TPA: hypothetical protein DCO89_02370 [Clostridiales bacterium]|nr:hypothetical protein [Clostridiales bacterium]